MGGSKIFGSGYSGLRLSHSLPYFVQVIPYEDALFGKVIYAYQQGGSALFNHGKDDACAILWQGADASATLWLKFPFQPARPEASQASWGLPAVKEVVTMPRMCLSGLGGLFL